MKKKEKYLFTIRSLTGGGAERVVSVLSSRMARDGYDVSVLAYDKTDHDYKFDNNVKLYFMPKPKKGIIGKIARIWDMKRLINDIEPDVIMPFVGTVLLVSYFASLHKKIKFIRTIRISPYSEKKGFVQKIMLPVINKKSAAIMVQNIEQIDYFPDNMREKIFVVPNPVDDIFLKTQKTTYSDRIKKIVTAGRLTNQKRHDLLIEAFAELLKEFPDITLDIYGEGIEKENLQNLIQKLKIEKNCILRGRNNNISKTLIDSDLFVLTSDFEGMPNALMEAMAIGLPCLSSDCRTGPKSLISHNENGLLYTNGELDQLKKSLFWAVKNSALMNEMGKMARKSMLDNYTSENVLIDLESMLDQI